VELRKTRGRPGVRLSDRDYPGSACRNGIWCVPEDVAATCAGGVCGTATNNCGQVVQRLTPARMTASAARGIASIICAAKAPAPRVTTILTAAARAFASRAFVARTIRWGYLRRRRWSAIQQLRRPGLFRRLLNQEGGWRRDRQGLPGRPLHRKRRSQRGCTGGQNVAVCSARQVAQRVSSFASQRLNAARDLRDLRNQPLGGDVQRHSDCPTGVV